MTKTLSENALEQTTSTGGSSNPVTSIISLAWSRWRQHWFLFLVICLGMIAAVIIVCSVPLLTETMQTAEVRNVMRASPDNVDITLNVATAGLSTSGIQQTYQLTNPPIQQHLGTYLNSSPRLDIQTPFSDFVSPQPPETQDQMEMYGTSMRQAASHVTLVQGRLPHDQAAGPIIDAAITPEAAGLLHLQVGSIIVLNLTFYTQPATSLITSGHQAQAINQHFSLRVVGLFNVNPSDPYWHAYNFLPDQTTGLGVAGNLGVKYYALVSEQTLLAALDQIAAQHSASQVFFSQPSTLSWYYRLDPSHISITQLDDLRSRLAATQSAIASDFSDPYIVYQPPYLKSVTVLSPLFSSASVPGPLDQLRGQLTVVQIPVALLAAQILCLLLFFVGMMAALLVERQADALALLRSRGASGWQMLAAFAVQSVALGLIALVIGVPLAIIAVYFIAQRLLPAATQDAVNIIANAPIQALLTVRWYAIITVVVAIATLILSLYRTSRTQTWATSNSPAMRRPLWQRLNLDILAIIVALAGYAISVYLSNIQQSLTQQAQATVTSPLALLAPLFLFLAIILLFLRLFPLLLQLASNIAMRGRGAVPMLAVAQMARTPRQPVRMILLLSLATAFATFTLLFSATQAQRAQDIATYVSGADFSGEISSLINTPFLLNTEIARYRHIPGVLDATAGYIEDDTSSINGGAVSVELIAVDPATFGQATIWTAQDSSQPLSSMLSQLASRRNAAIQSQVLPVYVDAATWNALKLHLGATFSLFRASSLSGTMHYVVIGEVQHIPGITSSSEGGMFVDYQSFATVQQQLNRTLILPNHVWLHTRSDPASLASVRAALNTQGLQLNNLFDRRLLSDSLRYDPLALNLIALLALGSTTALLLALVGNLLISWLSVRRRLTNFTVLRALGAAPKQVASILTWEQGIIYATALLLGVIFGVLLAVTAIPALVFTSLPAGIFSVYESASAFYELQHIIPASIVVPPSLGIALLVLIAICIIALALMVRIAIRPSMSLVLRLDENQSSEFLTREDAAFIRSMPQQATSQGPTRSRRPSFITLARWQLRQAWFLLLVEGIGIIAAVTIVCAVPLFSTVATTASLHQALNATPDSSTITVDTTTQGLSSKIFSSVQQTLNPLVQQYIGAYLSQPTPFLLRSAGFTQVSPTPAKGAGQSNIQLTGALIDQAAPYLTLLQGRLPQAAGSHGQVEVLLTPQAAQSLHLSVGSVIKLQGDFFTNPAYMFGGTTPSGTLTLHVVGLFTVKAASGSFWHGQNFLPVQGSQGLSYTFLVPAGAFLAALDHIAAQAHADTVFSPQTFELTWYYHLDTRRISVDQVDNLTNALAQLQASFGNKYGNIQNDTATGPTYPYLVQVNLFNPVPGSYDILNILYGYFNRSAIVSIPIAILTLQAFALILFFVSLVINLLVERQAEAVAIQRSRGASSGQIFGALLTQSVALAIIALVAGPILAIIAVTFIAQHIMGSAAQDAVALVASQPLQAVGTVIGYALAIVLVMIIAMALLLWRASHTNELAIRREAARTTQRPLWQRLNLDLVAAIIALLGYGISLYLASISNLFDPRTQVLVAAPLTLIAPLFLLITILILFLRFFTFLLQVGARFAVRGKGATSMLALAQMARAPRQSLRMTMLLALATAFAIFTLVFAASQGQHISDVAAYESGADFSGDIPITTQRLTVQHETTLYQHIPGVTSTTVGYTGEGSAQGIPLQIRAVDASTFAHTGIWTSQDSSQSLAFLMRELNIDRQGATANDQVPAIIDAATAQALNVQPGDNLQVDVDNLPYSTLNCIVIDVVQHIPTVNDSTQGDIASSASQGGLVVDYATYAAVYKQDILTNGTAGTDTYLPINHIWLRTQSDPASLAHVRAALATPGLQLSNLYDRRLLADTMSHDPLYLSLIIILVTGAVTALLLILVGNLLASWLSVRVRLTNFAVLRALGASPLQVTRVLLWEQVLIYSTALLLGIIFGAVLSATAVPTLAFTSIPATGVLSSLSSEQLYAIQHIIPAQIVVPLSLGLAFAGLVAICGIALAIMAGVVLRPSMSQTLRLNED